MRSLEPIDTLRVVGTPEGAALELRLAGPLPRVLAWALDLLIRGLFYGGAAAALLPLGDAGSGLYMLLLFAGEWFYPVAFELLNRGATPGKTALGLAVLHDDGTPVGWQASLLRNLLRFADFLPMFYLGGLAAMTFSRHFQRLGDFAAGTVVVHRARVAGPLPHARVEPRPPPIALTLEEQRAVIDFAERSPGWSHERDEELASLARPLLEGAANPAAQLRGLAAWLVGRR